MCTCTVAVHTHVYIHGWWMWLCCVAACGMYCYSSVHVLCHVCTCVWDMKQCMHSCELQCMYQCMWHVLLHVMWTQFLWYSHNNNKKTTWFKHERLFMEALMILAYAPRYPGYNVAPPYRSCRNGLPLFVTYFYHVLGKHFLSSLNNEITICIR